MTCSESRELFSDVYDRASGLPEGFRRHLDGCGQCRGEYADYTAVLGEMEGFFRDSAESRHPARPFPGLGRRNIVYRQAVYGLLAAATLAMMVAGLRVLFPNPGPPAPWRDGSQNQPPVALLAPIEHAEECAWRSASTARVATEVAYPIVAHDCLAERYELVDADVLEGEPCDETVRLTYQRGSKTVVLEQAPGPPPDCCSGAEQVIVGDLVACLEHGGDALTAMSWSQNNHRFSLRGEVGLGEAVRLARAISERFD